MALIIIMRKSALALFLLSSFNHCLSLAAPVYNGLPENRSLSHRYHELTKSEPQWKSEPMTEGYGRPVDQWNKELDVDEKPPYFTTAPSPVSDDKELKQPGDKHKDSEIENGDLDLEKTDSWPLPNFDDEEEFLGTNDSEEETSNNIFGESDKKEAGTEEKGQGSDGDHQNAEGKLDATGKQEGVKNDSEGDEEQPPNGDRKTDKSPLPSDILEDGNRFNRFDWLRNFGVHESYRPSGNYWSSVPRHMWSHRSYSLRDCIMFFLIIGIAVAIGYLCLCPGSRKNGPRVLSVIKPPEVKVKHPSLYTV